MIARASRTLPGMVVTMLLAVPAMASTAPAASPNAPVTHSRGHFIADHRKIAAAARVVSSRAKRLHPQARVRSVSFTRALPSAGAASPSVGPVWTDASATGNWSQTGVASWYGGKRWHGHLTTSGERFDQDQLTAAHATLPMGTRVRVTLEGSDRSVIVVINDRPGTHRRIIDLSRGAARELGMLNSGIAVVTLQPL